jgi:hypothetical protein
MPIAHDKRTPTGNPHRSLMIAMISKQPLIIMSHDSTDKTHDNQQQEKTHTEMQAKFDFIAQPIHHTAIQLG